jgi:ribosomal protein L21
LASEKWLVRQADAVVDRVVEIEVLNEDSGKKIGAKVVIEVDENEETKVGKVVSDGKRSEGIACGGACVSVSGELDW